MDTLSHAGPAAAPPSDRRGERENLFIAFAPLLCPRTAVRRHMHERLWLEATALCQQLLRLVSFWHNAIASDKMTFSLLCEGERRASEMCAARSDRWIEEASRRRGRRSERLIADQSQLGAEWKAGEEKCSSMRLYL